MVESEIFLEKKNQKTSVIEKKNKRKQNKTGGPTAFAHRRGRGFGEEEVFILKAA